MIRLISFLVFVFIVGGSIYVYYNSQRTFEAKFKNVDGLPKGAPVTALGVKIGEVIRTKLTNDGIIVTVRITNKSIPRPQAGSQLTITSFRPSQGRILEIIPPDTGLSETKAWIIQEPITTESWLHAAFELLEGLKSFSQVAIKYVTPETFEKARLAFQEASESLSETAEKLRKYEEGLLNTREEFAKKADEANLLILKIKKPVESLNKIITDKNITTLLKDELSDFAKNLTLISTNITSPDFKQNIDNYKTTILNELNQINDSLMRANQRVNNSTLRQKIKDFNEHVENLNVFYDKLNKQDIKKLGIAVKKAREVTTKLEEQTSAKKNDHIKQN